MKRIIYPALLSIIIILFIYLLMNENGIKNEKTEISPTVTLNNNSLKHTYTHGCWSVDECTKNDNGYKGNIIESAANSEDKVKVDWSKFKNNLIE